MEAHRRLVGVRAGEGAEPAEGPRGRVLVERADGASNLRLDVVRVPARSLVERARCGQRTTDTLQADSVQQLPTHTAVPRRRAQRRELASRRQAGDRGGRGERRDERGQATREIGMEEVPGDDRVRRVRLGVEDRAPGLDGIAGVRPQPREAEVELHDRDPGIELRELLEPVERAVRPLGERRADLRLERVVPGEERRSPPRGPRARRVPAPRMIDRASGSERKPSANESGGLPSRSPGEVVLAAVPAESPSDERIAAATAATAATATAATRSATRRCADTAGR